MLASPFAPLSSSLVRSALCVAVLAALTACGSSSDTSAPASSGDPSHSPLPILACDGGATVLVRRDERRDLTLDFSRDESALASLFLRNGAFDVDAAAYFYDIDHCDDRSDPQLCRNLHHSFEQAGLDIVRYYVGAFGTADQGVFAPSQFGGFLAKDPYGREIRVVRSGSAIDLYLHSAVTDRDVAHHQFTGCRELPGT